jgi:hypothetical protein
MATASSSIGSDQRAQAKPTTPIVVNAPTTNTTVIAKNETKVPPKTDSAKSLTARVS